MCPNFLEPRSNLFFSGLRGLDVILTNLLFNERSADQLLQGAARSEFPESDSAWVENGKLNLVFDVTGENGLMIHNSYYPIQRYRSAILGIWIRCLCIPHGETCGDNKCKYPRLPSKDRYWEYAILSHQKVCPRLKKKLK